MSKKPLYCFDSEKNTLLTKRRGVSFEEIISVLEEKGPLDIIENPNTERYPGQEIFIVEMNRYIYLVPFSQEGGKVFLKTIFPSRKMKKKYLKA